MAAFTLTRKARADLKAIAMYTERKWGREQRRIYAKQFDDIFHMLSERPNSGHQYDFVKIGLRKLPCGSHLIFFQCKTDTEIEIIRILHKRMDVRPQLTNT